VLLKCKDWKGLAAIPSPVWKTKETFEKRKNHYRVSGNKNLIE
jgi:hypothetical protein